jgi:hypothetical protein
MRAAGLIDNRGRAAFDRALGPLRQYLERPTVYNVNANPDGRIFVEERGRGKYKAPETKSELQREGLIGSLPMRRRPIPYPDSRHALHLICPMATPVAARRSAHRSDPAGRSCCAIMP